MHDALPGDTLPTPDMSEPIENIEYTETTSVPETAALSEAPRERRALITRQDILVAILLIVILAFGTYFRFTGQNWDDYTHLHPDERFLTGVVEAIGGPLKNFHADNPTELKQQQECPLRYPETNGAANSIFDSFCSPWYPKNVTDSLYVYGELPLYVVKFFAQLTAQNTGQTNWLHYNGIHLVGRSVSAVADLIGLVFLFLIGRKLYNKWIGLLAAALMAAAVFPIQISHFWTTDGFSNLPTIIAFWFAVRIMERCKWYDFLGFGLSLAAALASRINLLPLFGVGVLAAIVYALPALDMAVPRSERNRLLAKAILGCLLVIPITGIAFRIMMPHAFEGGPGILGFFNIKPYAPWLDDIRQASAFSAGQVDFPPNHQWASRTPYLFPWRNMVFWGMGLPLGLMAWFGWAWAALQILRAKPQWTRHILPVTWIMVYFGYMGRQWVTTMRYFLPLYPYLILLAAWAMYEIVSRAWRWMERNPTQIRRLATAGGVGLLIVVLLSTYLWAGMFVRIYQRQLTRVEASRWVFRNLPGPLSTSVQMDNGETRLINIDVHNTINVDVTRYLPQDRHNAPFFSTFNGTIDRVLVSHIGDPEQAGAQKTFNVAIALDPGGTDMLSQGSLTADFGQEGAFGESYTIDLQQPVLLNPAQTYYLVSWTDARLNVARTSQGSQSEFLLTNVQGDQIASVRMPIEEGADQATGTVADQVMRTDFTVPIAGTIDHINATHVLNLMGSPKATVNVRVFVSETNETLTQGSATIDARLTKTSPYGESFSFPLDKAIDVWQNQRLAVEISTDGTPIRITGTVIASEGSWDDPIPWTVCAQPPDLPLNHDSLSGLQPPDCPGVSGWGNWYKGVQLEMAYEDEDNKRINIEKALNVADVFFISSNRFYDTLTRMPMRFPMSVRFYDALFANQAGYDLAMTISSFPSLGSFEIADQYLPTYTWAPKWINEWESEEAFSVYDHPTVFMFKRSPNYSQEALDKILTGVSTSTPNNLPLGSDPVPDTTLVNRVTWNPTQSSAAPTGFMMTDAMKLIQQQGGTWSELFNRTRLVNTNPMFAVVVFWLTLIILGLAAWPLLFALLPGLPDRGYPLAKIAGLLIVAWIVWALGTLKFLAWSSTGIGLTIIGLILVSTFFAIRHRAELGEYIRLNWRHLLIVELITFILFVAFLFVRLGNPDLWAQSLGGEKPMDFAYFNAVLRSTVFPPYDPWYAGGYLNYYYFGFVYVGVPVKLLGIMPSVAYNLVMPMLFAFSGIGAFSLAFNIAASRWFHPQPHGDENDPAPRERRRFALRLPPANPYIAGTLALLMCVVLGNLDTPRVLLTGLIRSGGYSSNSMDMYTWKMNEFVTQNGRQPDPQEANQIAESAVNPPLNEQISFSMNDTKRLLEGLTNGISQMMRGGALPISPERWFWAPRSVVSELPNSSNEINEMPYFTFVYADLHAHLIAMPMTLLALGWLLAELLAAGNIRRPTWYVILVTVFGGLTVGILQPTNTWDWFTYMLLSVLGLTFAAYLRRDRLGRRSVMQWLGQIGIFGVTQYIVALPFTLFWATSYISGNAIKSFEGNKTPIWAYFDIHGLFLFVIISLLVWQTVRLLRSIYVKDFIGRSWVLLALLAAIGLTVIVALFLFVVPGKFFLFNPPIPLAVIILPLLVWCIILFFVPDQSREMRMVLALTGLALGVTLGVEIVVLGADIGRQNTFFKFYFQAWIFFSIAAAVALAWLFQASERWRVSLRVPWLGFAVLLFTIAGMFPIMSTQGKIAMRMALDAPHTLDGNAYMDYATYYEGGIPLPLGNDYKMIRWLQDNVQGSPVILEGYMSEYKLGARIAISTGLPTIIGWRFHQQQQRTIDPLPNMVIERTNNVAAMYDLPDIATTWKMMQFFNVQYIIVGGLERIVYTAEGLAKFDEMSQLGLLKLVYSENGDKIYHVVPGAVFTDVQVGGR
jgi:YYY domain-containing protein